VQRIDAVVRRLSAALALVAAICGAFVMLLMSLDVINRMATGGSIRGAFEAVEMLLVLMVFLGIAYAERSGAHVRVRLMTAKMPPMVAEVTRLLGNLVALGIVAWMAYETVILAQRSVATGEFRMGLVSFPIWPGRVAVAVGLTLLTLELALTVGRSFERIVRRQPEDTSATTAAL
jgi:TRAP-type C4-dicarboxylate transport system permease small subunit